MLGCDHAPVLGAAEHSLDDVALLLDRGIAVELDLELELERDDDLGSTPRQPGAQVVAVVSLVADRTAAWRRYTAW